MIEKATKKLIKGILLFIGAVISGGVILFVALFLRKRKKK